MLLPSSVRAGALLSRRSLRLGIRVRVTSRPSGLPALLGVLAAGFLVCAFGPATAKPGLVAECKVDADCVLVAADCCDCAHGGKNRALPMAQKAGALAALRKRCATTMCAEIMSSDPTCAGQAACAEGKCVVKSPPPVPGVEVPGGAGKGSPDRGGAGKGSPDRGGAGKGSPDRGGAGKASPDQGGAGKGKPPT